MNRKKLKNIPWKIIKKLSNLNFSIFLLLLISSLSVIGTIIEQNQTIEYYQTHYPTVQANSSFQSFNWKIIIGIGLDHIYDNIWFLFVLILFFFSLTSCTFSRQLPNLQIARNWKFLQSHKNIKKTTNPVNLREKFTSNIIQSILKNQYFIFHQGNRIYAHKGLIGRIAPIFVHISLILTILGSLVGLLNGFTSQEIIPKGEFFHIKNIVKVGQLCNFPVELTGQIQNFGIQYNQDSSIKQFFSTIIIRNNKGLEIAKKTISVNQPLTFNSLSFYQTNWRVNAIRINIGYSKNVQIRTEKKEFNNRDIWVARIPISNQKAIFFIIYSLNNKVTIYKDNGDFLTEVNINENFYINQNFISIKEIIVSTGIQIKIDPGISIVYTGFFILMITTITSYISYSQIWVYTDKYSIRLLGSSNRNILSFENDFAFIQKLYIRCTTQKNHFTK